MKKRLTNNLGLKLGSIIAAALLWLVVVNIDDPVKTEPFGPIPVNIINESAITSEGKVYQVLDESDSIHITVKGNRSVVEKMKPSDFTATADMKDLIFMDTVPITVTPNRNENKVEITSQAKSLKVSIEDAETKQFAVTVKTKGTPGEGYAIGTLTPSPNIVKITGPESIVKKVSQIRAEVNVENMNGDDTFEREIKLYDSDGDLLDSSRIKFSTTNVRVFVDILETKSVGFNFSVYGVAAEGYRYTDITYEPTKVTIAGSSAALGSIQEITVPSTAINIDGATGDIEKVIDITEYLPNDVKLVDDTYSSVLVTVKIEQLEAKTITIPDTNIQVQGLADNLDYDIQNAEGVAVTVRGLKEELDSLDGNVVTASIDVKGKIQGNYSVPVTVSLGGNFEIIGEVTAQVSLSRKTTTTPNSTPANTGTSGNTAETETDSENPSTTGGSSTTGTTNNTETTDTTNQTGTITSGTGSVSSQTDTTAGRNID